MTAAQAATSSALPMLIGVLLAGASAASALPRHARALAVVMLTGAIVAAGMLLVTVLRDGAQHHALGGWTAPLGIRLTSDIVGATVTLISLVVMLASMWAPVKRDPAQGFWVLWCWLAVALVVAFNTADLFNAYVALELLGLSAAALVALGGGRAALHAATRYLLVGLVASGLYLLGVVLVYAGGGRLSMDALAALSPAEPVGALALALLTAGALVKAAVFPLHGWLPPAHASAPAPASAVLSGLVVKAAVVLVWRVWSTLEPGTVGPAAAWLLGALGTGAIAWGAMQAMRAVRLKALLAWSTVAQVGYLLLVAALMADGVTAAAGPGTVLLVVHALAKAAAFAVAGAVIVRLGSDEIDALRGLVAHMPVAAFTLALAAIALVGLPPAGSFLAKWELLVLTAEGGHWVWFSAILAGTFASAAYLVRPLARSFEGVNEAHPVTTEGPAARVALALSLACAGVFLVGGPVSAAIAAAGAAA